MEPVNEKNELPLLPPLRGNGATGQPYVPVEPEQTLMAYLDDHPDPQLQMQSGLTRFSFVDKENALYMLDFVPKILHNKENWTKSRRTWLKIEKVQAWNIYHLLQFVWSDMFNKNYALPCGLSHDELTELIDLCEYADTFKRHFSSRRRERFKDMLEQLDFFQRSAKSMKLFC